MAATTEEMPRPHGRGTSSVVSFVVAMNRVDVVDLVVDLVDVDLDIDLVDVDLDVDLVDIGLVDVVPAVLLVFVPQYLVFAPRYFRPFGKDSEGTLRKSGYILVSNRTSGPKLIHFLK